MPRMAIRSRFFIAACVALLLSIATIAVVVPNLHGKSTSKMPKIERSANKSLCQKVRSKMGRTDFAASYGRKRSISRCMSHYRSDTSRAHREVRKGCRAARKADPKAFRKRYGRSKSTALRKCARRTFNQRLKEVRRHVRQAVSGCKRERRTDPSGFADKYRSRKKGVSLRRCINTALFDRESDPSNPGTGPTNPGTGTDTSCGASGGRITISLPFADTDTPYGLIPLGETVNHPKPANPRGHPGIDFQWNHKASILAAADGVVTDIVNVDHPSAPNTWDVLVISNNCYQIGYTELESHNPALSIGGAITAGSFIGYPQHPPGSHSTYRMIHWEFGYFADYKMYPDRLCPMTYFDSHASALIEQVWANTAWESKPQFPLVCSGDFNGADR